MKKTLAVFALAMIAALALCFVGCGGGNSNGGVVHYYQMEKLLSKTHSEIHKTFENDGLTYIEVKGSRAWADDKDVLVNKFNHVSVRLKADKRWNGENTVPESEIDSDDYKIEEMIIGLSTTEPLTSLYNSKESAAKLADEIMSKCELTNVSRDEYKEQNGTKTYLRYGTGEMNGEDAEWEIHLSDDKLMQDASIKISFK